MNKHSKDHRDGKERDGKPVTSQDARRKGH